MKYIIYGLVAALIVATSVVSIMAINAKGTRENELQDALEASIEEALLTRCNTQDMSDKELEEEFTRRFLSKIQAGDEFFDSNLGLKIDFIAADARKGLLSVKVRESYTKLFANIGSNEVEATAVVDYQVPDYEKTA